jgi:hypothetical protein
MVPATLVQLGLLPPLDFRLSQLAHALTSAMPSMSTSWHLIEIAARFLNVGTFGSRSPQVSVASTEHSALK